LADGIVVLLSEWALNHLRHCRKQGSDWDHGYSRFLLANVPTSTYDLGELFLRGNVQAIFFHFLVELTRVFAGTFLKNKHGVADIRADL
jgi:hypothetical protein